MSDDAITKAIDFICKPYSFGVQQGAAQIMFELLNNGIEPKEFMDYVAQKIKEKKMLSVEAVKERQALSMAYKAAVRRCEKCGKMMNLFPVNNTPRNQVGGPWRSMWQCIDLFGCGEEILSELGINEERKKYGLDKLFKATDPRRAQKAAARIANRNRRA